MQLLKIFVFVNGAIVIIANLIDESPLSLLAGLGAVSVMMLLIFQDTIMLVVASVQLGSNDMLQVGDQGERSVNQRRLNNLVTFRAYAQA